MKPSALGSWATRGRWFGLVLLVGVALSAAAALAGQVNPEPLDASVVAVDAAAEPPSSDAGPPPSSSDAGGATGNPFHLPGTQPGELTQELRSPDVCGGCHGYYADYSPNDSWQGSMMANATRDPLFQAALAIANQDVPGSGDLCIRCHSPDGWLFGRSSPPELATLIEDDYEGVACDFCHRLEPAEPLLIGTGQYTVADDFIRRGPRDDAQSAHESVYSAYHESSELCGLCHDVSNPAEGNFAIERTYSEWKASAFAPEGQTCQNCHMPRQAGFAAGARNLPERQVAVHELAGGNTWVPRVLAAEHPELGRGEAYERTAQAAERMLQSAAELTLLDGPRPARGGSHLLELRVENLTGHKLPTGYPEGRRCWLEVEVRDGTGRQLLHSGRYDYEEAERVDDVQLRTYEVKMASNGVEGFHFVLQNELLQDNRIPPRGFVAAADTRPVGRDYPSVGERSGALMLAHWDVAPYRFEVPAETVGPLWVAATLWYQTTSREYVAFLRDENRTDATGQRLFDLWMEHDQAPPVAMAELVSLLILEGDPLPNGGDAGVNDAGAPNDPKDAAVVEPSRDGGFQEAGLVHADAGGKLDGSAPDMGGFDDGGKPLGDAGNPRDVGSLLDASDASGYVDAQKTTGPEGGQPTQSARSTSGCDCAVGSRGTSSSAFVWVVLGSLMLRRKRIRIGVLS